ncbi:I78 family peptidase inhibitor [Chromohalobacter japonicus]|uniref:I78 family peptidase inhibitor n=1 Tax=Chromohalobacter japonicus TaxID=223900 RepID=UPI003F8E582F
MSKRALGSAVMTLMLAGCAGGPAPDEAPQPPSMIQRDACGAEALQGYLGQRATDKTLAELETDSDAERVRVIGPNQAVTMDYRADRLNVKFDDQNNIVELICG